MTAIEKHFEELGNDPKIKDYFESLIGLEISEARKRLGYWWRCTGSHWPLYQFKRAAGGYVQLHTNEKNIVVSEHHNGMALRFAQIDIYEYKTR